MRFAFVMYDGMTALDFIGAYDPLIRLRTMGFLPELTWDICARTEEIEDNTSLKFRATRIAEPLDIYDLVFVPGGFSTRELIHNQEFIQWIATAGASNCIASVCTGSVLLGAAGLLNGHKATTHLNAFELLQQYCPHVVDARVVESGNIITARGVSSSIDLGLYLCEKFTDYATRINIQQQMDYENYSL